MPQIIVEHSDNINVMRVKETLPLIHSILVQMLPTDIATCKSRLMTHDHFLMAEGHPKKGFVHVDIKILSGRDEALVKSISERILLDLKQHFQDQQADVKIGLSVAIDLLPHSYCKGTIE